MENDSISTIIDEAKDVAEAEFDEVYPLTDPNLIDQMYTLRKRAEIASNATITLTEYSVNLNEAIIRIMLEMLKDDLYLYLGEEYSSLHEWAHSKLGDIAKSDRTINRWVRVAMAIHKTYMEGLIDDTSLAFQEIGVTKAEVMATAHDLLEAGSDELEATLEEIMDATSAQAAKEILHGKVVDQPKAILIAVENPDGLFHVSGYITFDQLVEWQVSLSKHIDFRMAE